MKLCVIGNSHVGALKRAWSTRAEAHPEMSVTFFAGRGGSTRAVAVEDGQIVAKTDALRDQFAFTSGGPDRIDPTHFDVFLAYGGLHGARTGDAAQAVSAAFARRATVERARESMLYKHARLLRDVTDKPVFAAPAPLPAARDGVDPPRIVPLAVEMELIDEALFAPLGVDLVPQPPQTRDGEATMGEFAQGSERLESLREGAGVHGAAETAHMNEAYGDIWLEAFLARLSA